MGQHDKSRMRIRKSFAEWVPPVGHEDRYRIADQVLDNYLDGEHRATEWDADLWGLPDESVCLLEPSTPPDSWAGGLGHLARSAPRNPVTNLVEHWPSEPAKWEL